MRLLIDLQGAQGPSRRRGIGRLSRELALAMARRPRGHVVEIALNACFGQEADTLAADFADWLPREQIVLWSSPGASSDINPSGALRRMAGEHIRAQAYAARAPDVVHVSSLFEGMDSDVITAWPRGLARLPTVATFYDAIPMIRHKQYLAGVAGPYLRRVQEARLCDGLLAISRSSRQEAIDYVEMPPDLVTNVGAGVAPHFRPVALSAEERGVLLRRYSLRDGFILFLGAGDIRKNEDGLFAGYRALPAELRARHQLAVVGGLASEDIDALSRHGLTRDEIVAIPYVEEGDMPALYSACMLFVLPSLHEGFGLPAAEAMACGAPVVASNTTSLPEVVGRADALFDPEDPAEIARCLKSVLLDDAFRGELAAHGPVQAARFTWDACADRAWDAIEAVHARTGKGRPRVLARRLKLAFVSPLPPDESGIADYSRDLLPALACHYDITLVASRGFTSDPWLAANFPVIEPAAFLAESDRFDRVVYQVGNSSFHRDQIYDLLPALPGVVVLHDCFLSGLLSFDARQQRHSAPFSWVLHASHGYPAVDILMAKGEDEAVRRFPCNLSVLQSAVGLIQHSRHAQSILAGHFGAAMLRKSALVPFPRRPFPPLPRDVARRRLQIDPDVFVVCSFGMVAASKLPRLVLTGWIEAGFKPGESRLVFVGDTVGPLEEELCELMGRVGLDPRAVIQRRVSESDYSTWLAAADVAVQLRTGSRGENSKAVADCLAAGLPTIVNLHGSIAELPPDVVVALPDRCTGADVASAIRNLQRDRAARDRISGAARAYCEVELHPAVCAQSYHNTIEAAYASGPVASGIAVLANLKSEARHDPAPRPLSPFAQALSATFPLARPPQFFVDITALEQGVCDRPTAAWLRAQCAELLRGHATDIRIEPIRLERGRLLLARDFGWTLLGFPRPIPPNEPAETHGGCVILSPVAGWTAERSAMLKACRRRGARLVMLRTVSMEMPPDAAALAHSVILSPCTDGLIDSLRIAGEV